MVRPARRTALAVSAAALALTASSSGSSHSVEAFHPPAGALPQHKHHHHHYSADAPIHAQSDAPSLASASANISKQRRRGSSFSPLAVSASTSLDGESAENGGNPTGAAAAASADALQSMALNTAESALSTLSSAADQVVTAVSEDSDYVDEYEVEQAELAKRRAAAAREAARRRNQYEITVPIVSSSKSTAKVSQQMVGLTLRQITAEGQISSSALDFDSTRLINNLSTEEEMDPTLREGEGSVEILGAMLEDKTMATSGGSGKAGVIVSSVVRDGAAWEAGVRPGDMILATIATVGQVRTTSLSCYKCIRVQPIVAACIVINRQRVPNPIVSIRCDFNQPTENVAQDHPRRHPECHLLQEGHELVHQDSAPKGGDDPDFVIVFFLVGGGRRIGNR